MPPSEWRGALLEVASPREAAAIAELRNAVARHLTLVHGEGPWSGRVTERGVRLDMTRGVVCVARDADRPIATLTLSRRKPWAIDASRFAQAQAPLYLTSMAVAPDRQRRGIGRRCMDDVRSIATAWEADALRLDAFDADAGVGDFYRKCGFREVGRATYRDTPLLYFELML